MGVEVFDQGRQRNLRSVGVRLVEADVQVALILDTSSSMDGLLNQARTQISDMIADLRKDREGRDKTVAVTVYHYGNASASEAEGYVEQLVPFTWDIETIREGLEQVRVGGEREFAPSALKKAILDSSWSQKSEVQKLIVIVGNEGFSQGPLGVQEVMDLCDGEVLQLLGYELGHTRRPAS